MKDIRLVATDLDRTLLTSDGMLPPDIDEYIGRLADAGVLFVAASGRPLPTLRAMFPSDGRTIGYVADNGGVVALGDRVLYESPMDPQNYREMVTTTLDEGIGAPLVCGIDATYVQENHRIYEETFSVFYRNRIYVPDLTAIDVDVDKFTVFFPEHDSREHYEALYGPKYGEDFAVAVAGTSWVDIQNAGVTKGSGVMVLGDHLGIKPEQMMAFGDTDNDLSMLEAVGHSYAVANADEHVKELAKYTALSNDEYGVTTILEKLLEAKG